MAIIRADISSPSAVALLSSLLASSLFSTLSLSPSLLFLSVVRLYLESEKDKVALPQRSPLSLRRLAAEQPPLSRFNDGSWKRQRRWCKRCWKRQPLSIYIYILSHADVTLPSKLMLERPSGLRAPVPALPASCYWRPMLCWLGHYSTYSTLPYKLYLPRESTQPPMLLCICWPAARTYVPFIPYHTAPIHSSSTPMYFRVHIDACIPSYLHSSMCRKFIVFQVRFLSLSNNLSQKSKFLIKSMKKTSFHKMPKVLSDWLLVSYPIYRFFCV